MPRLGVVIVALAPELTRAFPEVISRVAIDIVLLLLAEFKYKVLPEPTSTPILFKS